MSYSISIGEFSKSIQNSCIGVSVASILIILFILSPLTSYTLTSMIGRLVIIILLVYIIYYNTTNTNKFAEDLNVNIWNEGDWGNWNPLKTNVAWSYIFNLFLLVLLYNVVKKCW